MMRFHNSIEVVWNSLLDRLRQRIGAGRRWGRPGTNALSRARRTLAGKMGRLPIKAAAGPWNGEIFIVTGGTGPNVSACGSGILEIRYNPGQHGYPIGIKSGP